MSALDNSLVICSIKSFCDIEFNPLLLYVILVNFIKKTTKNPQENYTIITDIRLCYF